MVNSALIGRPPLTDSDYWIVKGNQLLSGKTNLDPSKGLKIPPLRPSPDQYRFESRGPAIMAVSSVVIVIMFSVTMARFMLRKFIKELRFGLDDWLMVPALVCYLFPAFGGVLGTDILDTGITLACSSDLRRQVLGEWETHIRCHVPRALYEQLGLSTLQWSVASY